MQKKLLLLFAATLTVLLSFSQSISPNENTELCPLTDITFTVTLPRIANNTTPTVASWTNTPIVVSGVSNLSHTPTQTTFTFVGKFRDININQVFKVDYIPSGGSATFYLASFKRIKSLFHGACTPIQPNQTTVTAARCQVVNIPISFNNVEWKTQFENPTLCFGSITTYEYQLPVGWSIGANVSTGTNWIPGNNNVTVTSDLSNGVNGTIKVRPVNSCGSGLQPGDFTTIFISRPAPTLSVSGTQSTICSIGGSATYSISGMPSGATVQWSLSGSDALIPGCSNCSTVNITRNTSTNTTVTLTATVTHCTFIYTVTREIVLGTHMPSNIYGMQPTIAVSPGELLELDADLLGMTTYYWSVQGGRILGSSNSSHITVLVDQCPGQISNGWLNVQLSYQNSCGIGDEYGEYTMVDCSTGGGGPAFAMSPNPAKDNVTIDGRKKDKSIKEVQLLDKYGNVRRITKYSGDLKVATLNVSGLPADIYYVRIFDGQKWESKQLSIR